MFHPAHVCVTASTESRWFYSLKFVWNRSQLVYQDFCLLNVLTKVLLQRNLCFISDQLRASEINDDHRHALLQVLLCFYFTSMFDGIMSRSAWRRRRLRRCHEVCMHSYNDLQSRIYVPFTYVS